jgi:ubiquitin carboxyl-terminal hydrolase 34
MDEIIRSNAEPILASRLYLQAFGWLLRKDEVPHIGRNLETHYHWNWNDDVSMLMNTFLTAGGNIPNLVRLTQGHLALISRFPKLIDNLTELSRIVNRAVTDAAAILNDPEASHRQYIETSQQIMGQGYQYYKVMAAGLISIIEKHVTFLSPDAATSHVACLTGILFYSLCFEGCPARELLEDHRRRYPDLPPAHSSTVISNEWKFEILNKLIVSGQMQLRVIGTTTMCSDLLNMFTKYKREDPTSHPLLLYFANFILQNKLVDYIVGTGSHPEIISESGNIVGFLVATKTYTTKQTDTIWQTVMTSQDPRVVEAILRMLGQILNLHTYDSLLYLCKKVGELPIESFTTPMREYCERLLQLLTQRATAERTQSIDAPPYELCVRLIRESSIARPDAPMGSLEIQHFASTILRDLIVHGPEAGVRNSIYVSCIEDISNRTQTSPGSICALFGLLRQNLATDLHILTTNHGLTRLMVEELEFTNSSDRLTSVISNTNSPARQARRELLLSIIVHEPSTITAELGTRLWNLLVGRDAQSNANREIGWQILNSAAKKASSTNVFIATCFKEHLPNLNPECYTIGSLDFAREAMFAWLSEAGDLLFETQSSSLSGVEQLWRMVLNAPPNTIEAPAVNMLVDLYVDSAEILKMSRLRAYNIHLALVNRCLSQLSSAASKLKCFTDETMSGDDEPMVIVASESQIREQELIFTRSLIFLREFLRSYQSKSHFVTPKLKSPTLNPSDEPKGEPLDIKYQAFDGGKTGEVQTLSMGKQNTMATLFTTIRKAAGFKGCKIYHWGKEIELDCTDLNASLEDLKIGKGLLLVQRRDEEDNSEGRLKGRSSTLELEIIKHFDELWDYLGMEEKLAKEIYYFLIKFPVYSKLLTAFENDNTPCTEIFPLGQPFKCLYAIHALREHLAARSREGLMDTATLSRSVGLIVSAITTREVLDSCVDDDLKSFLALHLTECLTKLLREPVPASSLGSHLNSTLLERLLQLLCAAKAATTSPNSVQLVANAFEATLEASFHSPQLWSAFRSHPKTPHLLCELILLDPRPGLRKGVLKQITSKCCYASSLSSLSTTEFAMTLWPILYDLVPQAVMHPQKCEEALSVTLLVFRKLADTSIDSVNVEKCLTRWGSLLVQHECREDVGHPESLDTVARGLANLLYWCASFAKAARQPLPPNTLATKLFTKHLFPELSNPDIEESIVECLPLLNTGTRKLISDTMLFLTKDDEIQYQQIMEFLANLLPYDPDEEMPYAMDLTFGFERLKSVRSSTGYVGLKNLSNTCYLNSLFTQLFMNISFRGFMLNAYVADGGGSQKLLHETQKLFSFMQNSLKRYVDPSNLAASIRTYEETGIDVSIQMDVDEFYNLLFDRWESQILSTGDKREFRSFYGGQLVQQVKSKECPHISERLEPFSAIQCDIKGKTSLQESLQAYVDGEIMEGGLYIPYHVSTFFS